MSRDDINRQAFREEASDLLVELESALLELEENPEDRDLIDRVFRAMHTIKGSGAMFGFDDIAGFTHEVETVFDRVRNGELAVTRNLLDLTLAAKDRIQAMLEGSEHGSDPDPVATATVIKGLQACTLAHCAQTPRETAERAPAEAAREEAARPQRVYMVRFKPPKDIFLSGTNPLALVEELCELGTTRVIAHLEPPALDEYEPEACYTSWDVIISTDAEQRTLLDVFIFVEDDSELSIRVIDSEADLQTEDQVKKLGEILIERGDITAEALTSALSDQRRLGTILTDSGLLDESRVASALAEQEAAREFRAARKRDDSGTSIRVAADKLDKLVDLVGELVIVQARISQVVSDRADPILGSLSEELERLSDELRDSTLGIRMLPIGTTFSKFRRLVRDLSAELGKKIEITTNGAETELDKTVIERLGDPLVHILRNSIDHGIEMPADRAAKGKPETGTIVLEAEHSGGEVLIRIRDDGKGLDAAAIKAKAVERGLIASDQELTEKEAWNLIFAPGFSTAAQVTSVSGRGVGMDVVRRAIESLRGSIDIDSRIGLGTTITIKLPLTLAIIDGLQVRVGQEFFVIPLSVVEECVELVGSTDKSARERRIVNLRGEVVPYLRIRECFEVPGARPPIEQIVVTSAGGNRVGIVVDNVIGEHQTVIKSLGKVYRDVEGISGATIKGDGSMALILDIPRLVAVAAGSAR